MESPKAGHGPYDRDFKAETYCLRQMEAFLRGYGKKTIVMEIADVYWTMPFTNLPPELPFPLPPRSR